MEGEILETLYLHDIPVIIDNLKIAANKSNIDTIESIEIYLKKNNEVILSVDDGYKSVKNLLPLLEKYDVKLICFIATGFIEREIYPYEVEISNFLEKNEQSVFEDKKKLIKSIEEKENFFKLIHQKLKPLPLEQRKNFMNQFSKDNQFDRKDYQYNVFMSWNEIKEIANHPLVEIGSHCVSHLFLPTQRMQDIYYELKSSKKTLQTKLNCNIIKLSYPYGGNNLKVRLLAKLAGYKEAYGTHNKKSTVMNIARSELKDLI